VDDLEPNAVAEAQGGRRLAPAIWFGNPRFIDSKISDPTLSEKSMTSALVTALET